MNYLKKHKLKLLDQSSQSPDLNIFENLWVDFKHAVCARRPKNISELEVVCRKSE